MPKEYTVAIVGCGSIAHAHVSGYQNLDNVRMVAVADPVEAARRIYQNEYDIPRGYDTIEQMLEKEKPDIVSVCTWHLLHSPLSVIAAQAGVKGVICEKPMAIAVGEADKMIEAADASGTKLVIGHQRRFTPGWNRARDLIREGAIGKPISAKNRVAEGLANWGTHSIDGTRFALDDPEPEWVMGAVERKTDRHERAVAIEDACIGFVNFDSGVQLFIESDLVREGASAGHFQIQGEEGMMEVTESSVRIFNATSGGWQDVELEGSEEDLRAIGGNTHAAQARELIEWIEGGPEHRGSGRQARVTVAIMMAIYESARRHAVVHFPLEEKDYPLDLMMEEGKLPVEEPGFYDIRGFLSRDGIDEAAFAKMWAEGMGHAAILRKLHEET